MSRTNLPVSKRTKSQTKTINKRVTNSLIYPDIKKNSLLTITIRYDDECGNGHNSFAITGDMKNYASGCIHDIIKEQAPELRKFIKWHLTSSDGPMHYVSNSLYHANDKDCWGLKKGEPRSYDYFIQFSNVPVTYKISKSFKSFIESGIDTLTITEHKYEKRPISDYNFKSKYSFTEYDITLKFFNGWYSALFNTKEKAQQWKDSLLNCQYSISKEAVMFGEGKDPDLNAARNIAVWPEAELIDFTKERLEERLPNLMEEFKSDMIELGFTY